MAVVVLLLEPAGFGFTRLATQLELVSRLFFGPIAVTAIRESLAARTKQMVDGKKGY